MKSLEQMLLAWQVVAENRIAAAQREGAFDDLPGMGQPLEEIIDISDPHGWTRRALRDCHALRDCNAIQRVPTMTEPSCE